LQYKTTKTFMGAETVKIPFSNYGQKAEQKKCEQLNVVSGP